MTTLSRCIAVSVTPLLSGSCSRSSWSHPASLKIHVEESSAEVKNKKDNASSASSSADRKRRRPSSPSSLPTKSNFAKQQQQQHLHHQNNQDVQWMLSQLTPAQMETAARSSYEYLMSARDPTLTTKIVEDYAGAMAARYLKSKKGRKEVALNKLKATLAFRDEMDMDGLRLAFAVEDNDESSSNSVPSVSSASSTSSASTATSNTTTPTTKDYHMLEKYLASGKNYVMSHDLEGRATHVFVPRRTQHFHSEWSLKESLYTIERAIACSKAPDQSVNAILDLNGFSPFRHSPPLKLGKDFCLTMRQHYAGHLHKIFILDAPTGFAWLWKTVEPFLGKATQEKVVFCSGNEQKAKILRQYYAPNEVAMWTTTKDDSTSNHTKRELDLHEYLYKIPFDKAFDE